MIDLRKVYYNLTWEPYDDFGFYQMFLDNVSIGTVLMNQEIPYNTIKGMILGKIQSRPG